MSKEKYYIFAKLYPKMKWVIEQLLAKTGGPTKGEWKAGGLFVCREDSPQTEKEPAGATYICEMDTSAISIEEAKANARHICKCVNVWDDLVAERDALKIAYDKALSENLAMIIKTSLAKGGSK